MENLKNKFLFPQYLLIVEEIGRTNESNNGRAVINTYIKYS